MSELTLLESVNGEEEEEEIHVEDEGLGNCSILNGGCN